ncbi:MAG: ribose-5-phosphate isomerase RpiA [Pseudomonadota bacterium]
MSQNELKQKAAEYALRYVQADTLIGVGTGSTVNFFIDAFGKANIRLKGAIASSVETERRLKAIGIPVATLADGDPVLYVDGADSCNPLRELVKGGGGALTREKIIAYASQQFVCIIDETKKTSALGDFPIPIEVLPMARSVVARKIVQLGGNPEYRAGFVTDNGNVILDVYGWTLNEPCKMEETLNHIPGVVCNGIFAVKPASVVLMATQNGIVTF